MADIIVMRVGATREQIDRVVQRLHELGLRAHLSEGVERAIIGVIGVGAPLLKVRDVVEMLPGVEDLVSITKPYKLASREFQSHNTIVQIGAVEIGGSELVVIAGPCSVESEEQTLATAHAVRAAGAKILRGGAFKPRTSPYSFRGLGVKGLQILARARAETGLPFVTEVMSPEDVGMVTEYADMLQIGARNMHNFNLLEEAGKSGKPVLLKRGMAATIEEWLLSAEYVMAQGNRQVVLCERGIRTFETQATRNTMDISAIPVAKRLTHLPVIADPSHGTGKWYLVQPLSLAAVAAGSDGLIIEVHPSPDQALSDGIQSLTFDNFRTLMERVRQLATVVPRPQPLAVS
ncbi:MAG: 3-deoxy-7-phosphoheptulonate synthase [Chloroflexi bacterium]|nr:3-deoxy-7-phosphoheptulonate synthase [Chloroflexota bacterium]